MLDNVYVGSHTLESVRGIPPDVVARNRRYITDNEKYIYRHAQ